MINICQINLIERNREKEKKKEIIIRYYIKNNRKNL
jgi:hypothetical protein